MCHILGLGIIRKKYHNVIAISMSDATLYLNSLTLLVFLYVSQIINLSSAELAQSVVKLKSICMYQKGIMQVS